MPSSFREIFVGLSSVCRSSGLVVLAWPGFPPFRASWLLVETSSHLDLDELVVRCVELLAPTCCPSVRRTCRRRQSHSSFNAKNEIVASSAIAITQGHLRNAQGEHAPYEVPRALETDEIPAIVEDYRKCSELAKQVGFDGVEIHAANGYLVDTFLQSSTNKRTDKYGGSIENRSRFLLEIVDAIKTVWSSDRIGVRLSPNGSFGQMGSEDNVETYKYVFQQLSQHNLAYVALLDGFGFGYHGKCPLVTVSDAKTHFKGNVFATNSYTRDIAEGVIRSGAADAVGFGRLYISNPELAERFQNDWPLNADAEYADYWDVSKGAEGYTTFPAYKA
ncbi:hypothetical protein Poli38472_001124 [Pythium oligandrum]|uniref:NADH:flavin oxidoreductase/NADH oxidase N-terminal domain-containing protein n=1 Tax=Pythium oligandrum TaxID=41045 RepID=A0A8K1FSW7_PYTOL|nr:hypothetical protein Poli38472_001124 [Pythium oligandrum]|eukprot:TMW68968.1 hypothetical protein Poli38472_001124 [Pythium oligandrum]